MTRIYSSKESKALVQQEGLRRAAINAEMDARLKLYEAALLRDTPNLDTLRDDIHSLVDSLLDGMVSIVYVVKNTDYDA